MKEPSNSGSLLDAIEIETGENPTAAIIWLHGLGADGNDFAPLVPSLSGEGLPEIRYILPHAPVRPITINGGMSMRGWFDILGMNFEARQDAIGIAESSAQLEALIKRENERGIASDQILLAGFSQGGAIALHTALRFPEKLAGVLALSTYLPLADTAQQGLNDVNRQIPIFMAHGLQDPVLPITLGERSRDALIGWGYDVKWSQYNMAHAVCPEEVNDIKNWLLRNMRS